MDDGKYEVEPVTTLDPTIAAFLADGGYSSVDEWMADSDFTQDPDGTWRHEEGHPVDPIGCIEGAIEASTWADEDDAG